MEELDQVEIPEHDAIDEELLALIHELVGKDAEEEDVDTASNVLFELIEQLVDEEEISEIPETEASEKEKAEWIQKSMPVLKEAFALMLKQLADEEVDSTEED